MGNIVLVGDSIINDSIIEKMIMLIVKIGSNVTLLKELNNKNTEAVIQQADVVLLTHAKDFDDIKKIVRLAEKYQIPIVFYPKNKIVHSKSHFHTIQYILLNEMKSFEITQIKVENQNEAKKVAKIIQQMGFLNVIITISNKGTFIMTDEERSTFVLWKTYKLIESKKAMAAFYGGFIHALSEKLPMLEAIRFANGVVVLSDGLHF